MKITQIPITDALNCGIPLAFNTNFYKLEQEFRYEKFSEYGAITKGFLEKKYNTAVQWRKAPKLLPKEEYAIWYYAIDSKAIDELGIQPEDLQITKTGLIQKCQDQLVKKDWTATSFGVSLSLEKIADKLSVLAPEIAQYFKEISFDKRQSNYDIKSFPKILDRQLVAIDKILTQKEVLITLPMGGGKSILIVIALKYIITNKRVLILCEKNKMSDWARDVKKEGIADMVDILNHDGIKSLFSDSYDIASNASKIKKRKSYKENRKGKHSYIWNNNYECLVVDEVTNFKNNSDRGKCLKKFIAKKEIPHLVHLTGTPYYTSIKDIVGMLANCTNHPLGKLRIEEFDYYWNYLSNNSDEAKEAKKKRQEFLKTLFLPSLFCKTFKDFPNDPQPPEVNIQMIPLEPPQNYINRCLGVLKTAKDVTIKTGEATTKVVNTSVSAMRIEAAKHKLEWVHNYIRENPNKKVFIVSNWNVDVLDSLSKELNLPVYKGAMKKGEGERMIEGFSSPDNKIFLGNIASVGKGVDGLQNTCYTIILLNVPHEAGALGQVIARAERPRGINSQLGDKPVEVLLLYFTAFSVNGKRLSVEEDKFKVLQVRAREMLELTGSAIAEKLGEAFDFEDSTAITIKSILEN